MQLHLRFAIVIIFILVHFPVSLCADDGKFAACSRNFQCGNLGGISYPFWGLDRPEDCGYPGFQLDCKGEAPLISIATNNFRVLRIDNRTKTLTVARTDYWNNSCPMFLQNTTMNFSLFSYVSDVQFLTLFYDCPAVNPAGKCNNSVRVPVFQSAAVAIGANSTTLAQALDGGFGLQWNASNSLCDGCVASGGQCGHIVSSGEFACYCNNGSSRSTCKSTRGTGEPTPTAKPGSFFKRHKWIKIAIGIVAGIIVVSIIVICSLKRKYLSSKAMAFWKKETKDDHKVKEFMRNHGYAPKLYRYSEVKKITKSFADELGKGGFGVVYKGRLPDGRLVAVKVLSQSKGNGEDFINEVASISRTSHINVVSLLGFCHERTKRALVYEFMPNGSLDKFIYHQGPSNSNRQLEWNTLYQIAVGIARGLEYLHRGCNTRILHFDIKPHNILLDENFCPKISDFGLAKLCRNGESTVSMQNGRGTPGYVAPEVTCRNLGKVSYKSDVYSYGMMVLEMVGGRKNIEVGVSHKSAIYFPQWIHNHLEQGQDLGLHGIVTEEEEEIARKMILVSLQCIQTIPSDRPTMSEVIEKLEGRLQSLEIPPMPLPSSPARPPRHSSTISSSS